MHQRTGESQTAPSGEQQHGDTTADGCSSVGLGKTGTEGDRHHVVEPRALGGQGKQGRSLAADGEVAQGQLRAVVGYVRRR